MNGVKGKKRLTPTQNVIMGVLKTGPKTIDQIGAEVGRPYPTVYRPVKALSDEGWIEIDPDLSAFNRANTFRIARTPSDGVELLVKVRGNEESVSFNSFLEAIARQREVPEIATAWRALPRAMAELALHAADEVEENGSVTEGDLLKILAPLARYEETLREQLSIVQQLRQDNRLWMPSTLKSSTLIKTDRPLSPNEIRAFCRAIAVKYDLIENEADNESESKENDDDDE